MGCCDEAKNYQKVASNKAVPQLNLPRVVHGQYSVNGNTLAGLALTVPSTPLPDAEYATPTFHPDGSIEYAKNSGDPPPEIDGYQRSPSNPWLFAPLWPACTLRLQGTSRKASGALDVVMLCQHPDHPKYGQFAKYADCEACPLRKRG